MQFDDFEYDDDVPAEPQPTAQKQISSPHQQKASKAQSDGINMDDFMDFQAKDGGDGQESMYTEDMLDYRGGEHSEKSFDNFDAHNPWKDYAEEFSPISPKKPQKEEIKPQNTFLESYLFENYHPDDEEKSERNYIKSITDMLSNNSVDHSVDKGKNVNTGVREHLENNKVPEPRLPPKEKEVVQVNKQHAPEAVKLIQVKELPAVNPAEDVKPEPEAGHRSKPSEVQESSQISSINKVQNENEQSKHEIKSGQFDGFDNFEDFSEGNDQHEREEDDSVFEDNPEPKFEHKSKPSKIQEPSQISSLNKVQNENEQSKHDVKSGQFDGFDNFEDFSEGNDQHEREEDDSAFEDYSRAHSDENEAEEYDEGDFENLSGSDKGKAEESIVPSELVREPVREPVEEQHQQSQNNLEQFSGANFEDFSEQAISYSEKSHERSIIDEPPRKIAEYNNQDDANRQYYTEETDNHQIEHLTRQREENEDILHGQSLDRPAGLQAQNNYEQRPQEQYLEHPQGHNYVQGGYDEQDYDKEPSEAQQTNGQNEPYSRGNLDQHPEGQVHHQGRDRQEDAYKETSSVLQQQQQQQQQQHQQIQDNYEQYSQDNFEEYPDQQASSQGGYDNKSYDGLSEKHIEEQHPQNIHQDQQQQSHENFDTYPEEHASSYQSKEELESIQGVQKDSELAPEGSYDNLSQGGTSRQGGAEIAQSSNQIQYPHMSANSLPEENSENYSEQGMYRQAVEVEEPKRLANVHVDHNTNTKYIEQPQRDHESHLEEHASSQVREGEVNTHTEIVEPEAQNNDAEQDNEGNFEDYHEDQEVHQEKQSEKSASEIKEDDFGSFVDIENSESQNESKYEGSIISDYEADAQNNPAVEPSKAGHPANAIASFNDLNSYRPSITEDALDEFQGEFEDHHRDVGRDTPNLADQLDLQKPGKLDQHTRLRTEDSTQQRINTEDTRAEDAWRSYNQTESFANSLRPPLHSMSVQGGRMLKSEFNLTGSATDYYSMGPNEDTLQEVPSSQQYNKSQSAQIERPKVSVYHSLSSSANQEEPKIVESHLVSQQEEVGPSIRSSVARPTKEASFHRTNETWNKQRTPEERDQDQAEISRHNEGPIYIEARGVKEVSYSTYEQADSQPQTTYIEKQFNGNQILLRQRDPYSANRFHKDNYLNEMSQTQSKMVSSYLSTEEYGTPYGKVINSARIYDSEDEPKTAKKIDRQKLHIEQLCAVSIPGSDTKKSDSKPPTHSKVVNLTQEAIKPIYYSPNPSRTAEINVIPPHTPENNTASKRFESPKRVTVSDRIETLTIDSEYSIHHHHTPVGAKNITDPQRIRASTPRRFANTGSSLDIKCSVHPDEYIDKVCTDPNYPKKRLLCWECGVDESKEMQKYKFSTQPIAQYAFEKLQEYSEVSKAVKVPRELETSLFNIQSTEKNLSQNLTENISAVKQSLNAIKAELLGKFEEIEKALDEVAEEKTALFRSNREFFEKTLDRYYPATQRQNIPQDVLVNQVLSLENEVDFENFMDSLRPAINTTSPELKNYMKVVSHKVDELSKNIKLPNQTTFSDLYSKNLTINQLQEQLIINLNGVKGSVHDLLDSAYKIEDISKTRIVVSSTLTEDNMNVTYPLNKISEELLRYRLAFERKFTEPDSRNINCVTVIDNQVLAAGTADQVITLWNIADGENLESIVAHDEYISGLCPYKMAVSDIRDKKSHANNLKEDFITLLISIGGKYDTTILFWDISWTHDYIQGMIINKQQSRLVRRLEGKGSGITALMPTLDGITLVNGTYDGRICVWNVIKNKLGGEIKQHKSAVSSLKMMRCNQRFASASLDKTICIWKIMYKKARGNPKAKTSRKVFQGCELEKMLDPGFIVLCLGSSIVNKSWLAFGGGMNRLVIWDVDTGKLVKEFESDKKHLAEIVMIEDKNTDKMVIFGACDDDDVIRAWDSDYKENTQIVHESYNIKNRDKIYINKAATNGNVLQIVQDGAIKIAALNNMKNKSSVSLWEVKLGV